MTVVLALGVSVVAEAAQLFVPVPEQRATAFPPEQHRAIEHLRHLQTTKSVRLVRINLEALKQPTVELNLRGDVRSTAIRRKIDKRSETRFTWYGRLADVPGDAILVVHGDAVEGTIRHGTDLYKIQSVGAGLHAVIQVDESKFPREEPPRSQGK